ncbi:MAG: SAM-dependent methyltransferase [Granulosicoccus sp.]|jgi:SAM-dependent methyltransferase
MDSHSVISLDGIPTNQEFGVEPTEMRETDHYQAEYVEKFVEQWDQLIDWQARSDSEGLFFIDQLKSHKKYEILDAATGTGFHSVQLLKAGFNVTSVDGNGQMLVKAFENAKKHGYVMQTVHSDWRWLNRDVNGKYDAIICLGNSFTHLFKESDRRRALSEFYAALKHDGILIIDQRNYDSILDNGFSSKHKYYYCGDKVSAQPVHVDDGLARFEYAFPDGSKHFLNMFPLRKKYMQGLLKQSGFQAVQTFGDFQETYAEDEPDFFVHIAQKAYLDE